MIGACGPYNLGGSTTGGSTSLDTEATGSALDVMDYGLATAKKFSNELTARMLLILRIVALGLLLQ